MNTDILELWIKYKTSIAKANSAVQDKYLSARAKYIKDAGNRGLIGMSVLPFPRPPFEEATMEGFMDWLVQHHEANKSKGNT